MSQPTKEVVERYLKTPKSKERIARYRSSPKGKFTIQRCNARSRGIEWSLTFDQWWDIWEPYWNDYGMGKLAMLRKQEPGPYSVDNVYIGTQSENMFDSWRNRRSKTS